MAKGYKYFCACANIIGVNKTNLAFKEKIMKYLTGLAQTILSGNGVDPYVRIAEIEYNKEYRLFVKCMGRQPTRHEAKNIIGQ